MRMSRVREKAGVDAALVEVEANECLGHLRALTLSSFGEVVRASSFRRPDLPSSHYFSRRRTRTTREKSLSSQISSILTIHTPATDSARLIAFVEISSTSLHYGSQGVILKQLLDPSAREGLAFLFLLAVCALALRLVL